MPESLHPVAMNRVTLLPSLYQQRLSLARRYVMSLKNAALLQNYYLEARLWKTRLHATPRDERDDRNAHQTGADLHWGWESPTVQLRGHFLGHWLSAAALLYAGSRDLEAKGKADDIVSELARCQQHNGGEWAGPIPEAYLSWTARGQPTWAPHYVIHKLLMGLLDMAVYAGNSQALEVLDGMASWFYRWTGQLTRPQMDDLLDVETGGMLEAWANLYHLTGDPRHLELARRYERRRLFEALLAGRDVLTNAHANTTIPEVHGAARLYEVTGDERWREIVAAYWRSAVTDRGCYCTGGQTSGEVWTPPFELSARLGPKNQEHCVVYNMIRLAEYLLRWTGEPAYADYIERNLVNGVLAQQHRQTGMVAYFLPLQNNARKIWGTPAHDFWCCHGTGIQANTAYPAWVFYEQPDGVTVSQYIPAELAWERDGAPVRLSLTADPQVERSHRPRSQLFRLRVACERPQEFSIRLRHPWWVQGQASVQINGQPAAQIDGQGGFLRLQRAWERDTVRIELPSGLAACPLPGAPDLVAFLDGPVVLAGLTGEVTTLYGDRDHPETLLAPENEREWDAWLPDYRTIHQERTVRFIPLNRICDERYTVYFDVQAGR